MKANQPFTQERVDSNFPSKYKGRILVVALLSVCLAIFVIILFLTFEDFRSSLQQTQPHTAKAEGTTFTFNAAGDYGANSDTTAGLSLVASSGADFNLALGDLSYDDLTPESTWCDYVKAEVGATFPFELISGNHEDNGPNGEINNFAACLPDRIGSITGTYAKQYYFDYQSLVRVIVISPDLTIDGETYNYTTGSARYNWVSTAIDGARSSEIPWVVVAMHKNCITIGVKSCEIGTDLMNLLLSKRVDLVLQGHEHNYQRSKQLTCASVGSFSNSCVADDGSDGAYFKGSGTVFVIVGTGGKSLYNVNISDSEAGYFAEWMGANANPRKGFMKFSVSSARISAQFVGATSGSFDDSFKIKNITHPNGSLIRAAGATSIYLIDSGQKRKIPSPRVFLSRFDPKYIASVSSYELGTYPNGISVIFNDGVLLKGSNTAIYVLSDGEKRWIRSPGAFYDLGYKSENIITVSDAYLASYSNGPDIHSATTHPNGSLIRARGATSIYLIDSGQKRKIPSPRVFLSRFNPKLIASVTSYEVGTYPNGSSVTFNDGVLLKGSGTGIYVLSDGEKRWIRSPGAFYDLGYKSENIITVSDAYLATYPDGPDIN
jgi:hypothetical protein